MVDLFKKLKKQHRLYCQGKKDITLKASCRYIEGILGKKPYRTQHQITILYGITPHTLSLRYAEISKLLFPDLKLEKQHHILVVEK